MTVFMRSLIVAVGVLVFGPGAQVCRGSVVVWRQSSSRATLILPRLSGETSRIVEDTINDYTREQFGWRLPVSSGVTTPVTIAAGNAGNNSAISELGKKGADISVGGLGEEGFRIVTFQDGPRQYLLLLSQTAAGLKFACQELVFFHLAASRTAASFDWPLNIRKTPQFPYRGIYMLPCWAQHDSLAHWKKVLRFNSELTCNRNYFWLDGFPLLPQYGGEYGGTDLAKPENVRELVALSRSHGMKFMIGGGWDTWHQRKLFGGDISRSVQYYQDLVKVLPGAEGIYLEPVGEGSERTDPAESLRSVDALRRLASSIWRNTPNFEFAIAAGKFNPKAYLDALDKIDRKRIYWTWGWGDPLRDNAPAEHSLVLRWHTIVKMSDWHGSNDAPRPDEVTLPGFYTSYDPGMGFGNTWNGLGYGVGTGIPAAREFDPHTIPYFAHEYWFRERAWDVQETPDQFSSRLSRRLFDADMPANSITYYLALQEMCKTPRKATEEFLGPIERFTNEYEGFGTKRNQDTIRRMQEAISGFRQVRPLPDKKKAAS